MPLVDHSLTYRRPALRHLPHRIRLRTIEAIIRTLDLPESPSYADFGCGGGYVTERVRRLIGAHEAYGFDKEEGHCEKGGTSYPGIQFACFDLVLGRGSPVRCDMVTCFETLEHVGRLDRAVANLVSAAASGGTLLISVPIEIGLIGLTKFALKLAYGYNLSELPSTPGLLRRYLWALLSGARISRFRDDRHRWAGHFGFDYRDLDDLLWQGELEVRQWNSFTTRFYLVRVRNSIAFMPTHASSLTRRSPIS